MKIASMYKSSSKADTDIVEVAPIYDNAGETTVLAAAEIIQSLVALMVAHTNL